MLSNYRNRDRLSKTGYLTIEIETCYLTIEIETDYLTIEIETGYLTINFRISPLKYFLH